MAQLLEINDLDDWLEVLLQCKPLDESLVKRLCEKVLPSPSIVPWSICV